MPPHPLRLCRLDERPLLGAKQLAFPSAHFRNCQAALFLDLHDPTRLRLSGRRRQPSKGLNERQSLHLATKSDLAVDAKTNDVEDFLANRNESGEIRVPDARDDIGRRWPPLACSLLLTRR